ncbi:MAG: endonuclease/exonuclease/phosphatase family protein [Lacipirellulaceae bacterium]
MRSLIGILLVLTFQLTATASDTRGGGRLRVASYNVALYGEESGDLAERLRGGNDGKARAVAEAIQRVRPDVLLLCEIDYEESHRAVDLFLEEYLGVGQRGQEPIEFAHTLTAPVNTGEASGLDLDNDGATDGPNDAWGFGRYPGQYGMAVVSRVPFALDALRSFRTLRWASVPDARRPVLATGEPYHNDATWRALRLSSKSLWDVTIAPPGRPKLHLLCSHPTPPVFDGPEDRNGKRNADEVRLLVDYIAGDPSGYLVDDDGQRGGLAAGAHFVVLGDLNADPVDGDGITESIGALLRSPQVSPMAAPASEGGVAASRRRADLNAAHRGPAETDTADFSGDGHGNLRVDYALASNSLRVTGTGVFWPKRDQPGSDAVKGSDHRLVWVDLELPGTGSGRAPAPGEGERSDD